MTSPPTRDSPVDEFDDQISPTSAEPNAHDETSAASTEVEGRPSRRFLTLVLLIALGGFLIRLIYILSEQHLWVGGDGFSYYLMTAFLRNGHGIVNPLVKGAPQAANHPPLWPLLLVVPNLLGAKSFLGFQYFSIAVGTTSIVAVGYAGRRMVSERVGLISAAIMAVYAGVWMFERELLSETLLFLGSALTVLAAYRFTDRPSTWRAVVLAFACTAMALIRAEQLLLLIFLFAALVLTRRSLAVRRRGLLLGLGAIVAVLTLMPWTLYNEHRLHHPVYLTTTMGAAMAQGNCDLVYHGSLLGYYQFSCLLNRSLALPAAERNDPVRVDNKVRAESIDYAKHHLGRVPVVLFAREGRTWGFYAPVQTADKEALWSGSPKWSHRLALYMYWALLVPAAVGIVFLRRRRVSLIPVLAPFFVVAIAVALTFGQARYRAGAEVSLVLLAGAGSSAIFDRLRRPRSSPKAQVPSHDLTSSQVSSSLQANA